MDVLEQHDWLFSLVFLAAAVFVLWLRDTRRARGNSELKQRYGRRALIFFFWAGLPWAVIGIGILSGQIASTDDAFNLHRGVFPLLSIASIVAVWIALLYWLFARGGAEELAESGQLHFGLSRVTDPGTIKLLFVAMIAGGVLGLLAFIIANTQ